MTVEQFANLYVYYIEPLLRATILIALVVTLLQVVNVVAGGDKKFVLVDKAFNLMVKFFIVLFVSSGRLVAWLARSLLRIIAVLFDTIRDFFTSKI